MQKTSYGFWKSSGCGIPGGGSPETVSPARGGFKSQSPYFARQAGTQKDSIQVEADLGRYSALNGLTLDSFSGFKLDRVELVEQFGYDTKYAMHMLRLGYQGVEFLESGRLTLPMREPVRSYLMDVRQGRSNLADVLAECAQLELRLGALLDSSPLPSEPDLKTVESFVMDTYEAAWAKSKDCTIDKGNPTKGESR